MARPSGAPGNLTVLSWAGFKAAVSYTFDDALASQTQNYAALNALGVRFTFFLVCNNLSDKATWAKAAADGHEIGNHTAHHCRANGSDCAWGGWRGSAVAELTSCTTQLSSDFKLKGVWTMAAPYGDSGWGAAGQPLFIANRGVNEGQVGPKDDSNVYDLPAHPAGSGEGASTFIARIDAARLAGKWQIELVHSLGGDGGYNPITPATVVAAVNHATALGDVWVDSMVNVTAYYLMEKAFPATPSAAGDAKTWSWTLPHNFPPGKYLRVNVDGGTVSQKGSMVPWNDRGFYEIALDAGEVTVSP